MLFRSIRERVASQQIGKGKKADNDDYQMENELIESAYKSYCQNIEFRGKTETNDLIKFLNTLNDHVQQPILMYLDEKVGGLKFYITLTLKYIKPSDLDRDQEIITFTCPAHVVYNKRDVENAIAKSFEHILTRNSTYVRNQSGLVIDTIYFANLNVAKFNQLTRLRPGKGYRPLPEFLKRRKCIVNVESIETDVACFKYAFLVPLLNFNKNKSRFSKYYDAKLDKQYKLDKIKYPVSPDDIPMLEDKLETKINVFSFSRSEEHTSELQSH